MRSTRSLLAALALLALPTPAFAQAELTGTYIRYLGVGANGVMINSSSHSQQYTETGSTPYSCDLFFPGSPIEEFNVEATGTSTFTVSNTASSSAFTTLSGPTASGRTITWSGQASGGGTTVAVQETFSYNTGDHYATLDVTLTNAGATALTNVYYQRHGDPDFASCSIGTGYETANDVVRQPPGDTAALVVGSAGGLTLGIGAEDGRARAHVTTGITSETPSVSWASPRDPGGALQDVGLSIIFKEPSLPVGGTTSFQIRYVWGPDSTTVQTRFSSLTCGGLPDGTACAGGQCRGGVCCTGCWNGASCLTGTATSACGAAGALCATCVDGNPCTFDACSAGACSNPSTPAGSSCDDGQYCTLESCNGAGACVSGPRDCSDGFTCTTDLCNEISDVCQSSVSSGFCLIGGACYADGATNPANVCLVCDAALSTTAWSAAAAGIACNDNAFCTVGDACNGLGACQGTPRDCSDGASCTTDSCNEATDSCQSALDAGSCLIGGVCYASGALNPASPCQRCNPAVSPSAWSATPAGVGCEDGLYCTTSDLCDGLGSCLGGPLRDCADTLSCTMDVCDDSIDACVSTVATGCVIDGACVASGMPNPANDCEACQPALSTGGWSPRGAGEQCGDPTCADGTFTPAPTCDGAGACTPGESTTCDGAVCADPTSCDDSCSDDLECQRTHFCAGAGQCLPDVPDGQACDRNEMCESGFCADGVCCDTACDGTCESCNAPAPAVAGTCTPYAELTDPEEECEGDAVCDGAGMCTQGAPPGTSGCDCRAGGNGTSSGGALAGLALVGLVITLRRRRRRS